MTVSKLPPLDGGASGIQPAQTQPVQPQSISEAPRNDGIDGVDMGVNGTDVMGPGGSEPGGQPGDGIRNGASKAATGAAVSAGAPIAAQAAALTIFLNWLSRCSQRSLELLLQPRRPSLVSLRALVRLLQAQWVVLCQLRLQPLLRLPQRLLVQLLLLQAVSQ